MEKIPIQVHVRIYPFEDYLTPPNIHVQLHSQMVSPLVDKFLNGFDASVITYGQPRTGKTFTLYGCDRISAIEDINRPSLVLCCFYQIFNYINSQPEHKYIVTIDWVEINGDSEIRSLLNGRYIECRNITVASYWLQLGRIMSIHSPAKMKHSILTVTLEQQSVMNDGSIQCRKSTLTFADLYRTKQLCSNHELLSSSSIDYGLQTVDQILNSFTLPNDNNGSKTNCDNKELTTRLKNSFGGPAQTLIIVCVSPQEHDIYGTMSNIQFASRLGGVYNHVIINPSVIKNVIDKGGRSKNASQSIIRCFLCKRSTRNSPGIKLYKFPKPDSAIGDIWRQQCKVAPNIHKELYLCERHFSYKSFARRVLKKTAYPTEYLN